MSHENKEIIEQHLNVKLIPAKEYNSALQNESLYICCQADNEKPLIFNHGEDKTHGTKRILIHSRPSLDGNSLLITLKYWAKNKDSKGVYLDEITAYDEQFVRSGGPKESCLLYSDQIDRMASEFEDAVKHIDRFNLRRVNVWLNNPSPENAGKGLPDEICSLIAGYIG